MLIFLFFYLLKYYYIKYKIDFVIDIKTAEFINLKLLLYRLFLIFFNILYLITLKLYLYISN